MGNSMLNRARDRQAEKTKEKDPADLTGLQEPDWGNPGQDAPAPPSSESANEKAGGSRAKKKGSPAAPPSASRSPRRRGRPRGPQRVPLSVRILEENDRKLTSAVDELGMNPQAIVDEALELYFRRRKIHDPQNA